MHQVEVVFSSKVIAMDDNSSGNAGLMRRIVQLEREKDELQRDVETLCMQQSGFSGSIDIVSRMQARRAAGLEQELEACKQKLSHQTQENLTLQEELSEAYRAKGLTADAFKASMDKNKELEAEVKFYQSRMSGAFIERDKALMEVERLKNSEASLVDELKEFQKRVAQVKEECSEYEKCNLDLQASLKASKAETEKVLKVVDKFWLLRGDGGGNNSCCDDALDRAEALLEDEDGVWNYGFMVDAKWQEDCKKAELNLAQVEEQLLHSTEKAKSLELQLEEEILSRKQLEERLALIEHTSANLKREVEKECLARRLAEEKALFYSDHLATIKPKLERDLEHLQVQFGTLVAEVSALFEEAKREMVVTSGTLLSELEKRIPQPGLEETGSDSRGEPEPEARQTESESEERESSAELENGTILLSSTSRVEENVRETNLLTAVDDDSKRILAQALKEKVEALLLLSQQEERHYLESATRAALEKQVTEVKQKLAQVTAEKISALMDVAALRTEVQYLQERERELTQLLEQHRSTNAGGRLLPAGWSEAKSQVLPEDSSIIPSFVAKPVAKPKNPPTASKGYLKSWLRGLDISSSGSKTVSSNGSKSDSSPAASCRQTDDSNSGLARLLVENAALQERVASVHHLAQSAHRLRMSLVKVSTYLKGDSDKASIQAAMDVVETVKTEAKRLKVALGCSLPVSFQGPLENSPEDLFTVPLSEESEISGEQGNAALDSVSMAGIEIAELLLATSELQKSALHCRLDSFNTLQV
ncbi:hypothetical protein R1flu_010762 [Riccia fluitans]|uniref:Uncharacterized protein n=1 Tax=Riccia fluitans TaxID=41844 RepID=A0ABD1Z6M9_9MARC